MKQNFSEAELALAVESAFGVRLKSLCRIGEGAQSLNFIAQPKAGERFIVKVVPARADAELIISNCRCLEQVNSVRCLFDGRQVEFAGGFIVCLSFCEGTEVRFEQYRRPIIDRLLLDYERISHALQSARSPHSCREAADLAATVLELVRPLSRAGVYRRAIAGCRIGTVRKSAGELAVIHGDFHSANFRCRGGAMSGLFDFMEFRRGYPAEDFVRLVLCSAEKLRWYKFGGRRQIFGLFAYLVAKAGYPYAHWEAAIDEYLLVKLEKYARKRKRGAFFSFKLVCRLRLYRRLKQIAKVECA